MITCTRQRLVRVALATLLILLCAQQAFAAAPSPLPSADYSISPLCARPSFGYVGCLGLRLVASSPRAVPGARVMTHRASSRQPASAIEFKEPFEGSITPPELLGAYGLSSAPAPATTQTIAIVDAYDDPTAEQDLEHFDQQFELPACTTANGCFRKVNQAGNSAPLPESNSEGLEPEAGWALEIATDIEVAHSVCQACKILLVEARTSSFSDMEEAEGTAVQLGATEISNSWGGPECGEGICVSDSPAFNHPGIVITASSGDLGYLNWDAFSAEERGSADYPASSSHVIAVGGTRLLQSSGEWQQETIWNDGGQSKSGERGGAGAAGGGCSGAFSAPAWQQELPAWEGVGCGTHRAVADVAADADPYTGVAVYDSTPVTEGAETVSGWNVLGGTSVASPIIASTFALAGGGDGVRYPARTLYRNAAKSASAFHDVQQGSNGECLQAFNGNTAKSGCTSAEQGASCASKSICLAGPGYDGPAGVGTPNGIAGFVAGAGEAEESNQERPTVGPTTEEPPRTVQPIASGGGTTSPPSTKPVLSAPQAPHIPHLVFLGLTTRSMIALNSFSPHVSQVRFTFVIDLPARVKVLLAKRGRRRRWRPLRRALTINATLGRNSDKLTGSQILAPGTYRLTLTPQQGLARSLVFHIG